LLFLLPARLGWCPTASQKLLAGRRWPTCHVALSCNARPSAERGTSRYKRICRPNALQAANAAKVSAQAYARNVALATPPHAPASSVKQLWQPVHSFCSAVAASKRTRASTRFCASAALLPPFCRSTAITVIVAAVTHLKPYAVTQLLCTYKKLSMFYVMSLGAQRLATLQEKVCSLYARASHDSATAVACCCTRA